MYLVYLLRCSDGTLYTGYTTDLPRRLRTHNSGKGAKYTRARLPVQVVAAWEFPSKSMALSAEYRIRHLRAPQKQALIDNPLLPPELGALGPLPLGSEHAPDLSRSPGGGPLPPDPSSEPAP